MGFLSHSGKCGMPDGISLDTIAACEAVRWQPHNDKGPFFILGQSVLLMGQNFQTCSEVGRVKLPGYRMEVLDMVKDIVKSAIMIKLKCKSESPLISPAEFCCAAGVAVKVIGLDDEFAEHFRAMGTVEEMKEILFPKLEAVKEEYQDDGVNQRLLHLLLSCKVEGEVTDEIREIFDMGMH